MTINIEQDEAALQAELNRRQEKLDAVFAERDRLNSTIIAEREEMDVLQDQLDSLRLARMGGEVDWAYLLNSDGRKVYEERSRLLEEAGFGGGGQWMDTGQTAVEFRLIRGRKDEVARACAFVRKVLPAIKPHDGVKRFGVFEASLSEYGSYTAHIDEENNKYAVVKVYYGSPREVFSGDSLESLVQYLHDHLYYEEALS